MIFGSTGIVSASFTRPNDTVAYAIGDLVANSITLGSVAAMAFPVGRIAGMGGMVRRFDLRKTSNVLTNASFRLHLYGVIPAVSNPDNGAWLTSGAANYLGSMDVTMNRVFTDGALGVGVPNEGSEINYVTDIIYGLIEARGAYVPTALEAFAPSLEFLPN
jgi:hypothetical protein